MDKQRRYFVAKCDNIDRLKTASKTCIWACRDRISGPQPRDVLTDAISQCEVVLIFSVNGSHRWHGYAQVISTPDNSTSVPCQDHDDKPWHSFSIQWRCLYLRQFQPEQCLLSSSTTELLCDDGLTPANMARNLQELEPTSGATLCRLIDDHHGQLCLQRQMLAEKETSDMKSRAFFRPPEYGVSTDQQVIWNELISQVATLGKVHLACAFGSQRYNCHLETSDMDMFVVYAADTKDILGLKPVQMTIKSSEVEGFDYTVLEVSRFCELLVAGDPKCVETMFMHPSTAHLVSDDFSQLTNNRKVFLTRQCAEKYLTDATGQKGLKRLHKLCESGEALKVPMTTKVSKLVYVILRLLLGARDLFCEREFSVYREDDDPGRLLLMDVRHGNQTYDQVRVVIDSLLKEIEAARKSLSVSAEDLSADREKVVEGWLLPLRFDNFHEYMKNKDRESIPSSV